jgi:hypothetical protein
MAELGNLTACILLRLWRKSTVKIRAGSLFHTPARPELGLPGRLSDALARHRFPPPSTAHRLRAQDVHRPDWVSSLRRTRAAGAKSKRRIRLKMIDQNTISSEKMIGEKSNGPRMGATPGRSRRPPDVCPLCEGTGWKTVGTGTGARSANDRVSNARISNDQISNDRRRYPLRLSFARPSERSLLSAARIPRRLRAL